MHSEHTRPAIGRLKLGLCLGNHGNLGFVWQPERDKFLAAACTPVRTNSVRLCKSLFHLEESPAHSLFPEQYFVQILETEEQTGPEKILGKSPGLRS